MFRFILPFFIFFLFSSTLVYASTPDSLISSIPETLSNSEKVDLILSYCKDQSISNSIRMGYTETAYLIAESENYHEGLFRALIAKSDLLFTKNKEEEALNIINECFQRLEQLDTKEEWGKRIESKLFIVKAAIKIIQKRYYEGIQHSTAALKLLEELNDKSGRGEVYIQLGYVYERLSAYDLAYEQYSKAKQMFKEDDNFRLLILSQNNLGSILKEQGEYEKAILEYQQILSLIHSEHAPRNINKLIEPSVIDGMGFCKMKLNRSTEALEHFEKAEAIFKKLGHDLYLTYCELFISKIKYEKTKDPELVNVIRRLSEKADEFKYLDLIKHSKEVLTEVLLAEGNYKEAVTQSQLLSAVKDSIDNKDLFVQLRSIQLEKEYEISKNKIEEEKKRELLKAKLDFQNKRFMLLLFFISILAIAGLLLYNALKTTSKYKDKLVLKNTELGLSKDRLLQTNKDLQEHMNLNVELEQFAYVASHDIKAPLRTIQSFAGLLAKRYGKEIDDSGKTYLDFIVKGAKSLNLLVDDLLSFSKDSAKPLNITNFNLKELIDDVIQNLDFSISNVNGQVDAQNCNLEINADQIKIKQVLQNLISNALKFHDKERQPVVQISATEHGSEIVISVKDNGIGIPEDQFESVFQKFTRLNTNDEYEGTGLGLSICAKYIKEHAGQISLKRNIEFGVTFIFSISKNLKLSRQESLQSQGA